jgi:hypothetical protein
MFILFIFLFYKVSADCDFKTVLASEVYSLSDFEKRIYSSKEPVRIRGQLSRLPPDWPWPMEYAKDSEESFKEFLAEHGDENTSGGEIPYEDTYKDATTDYTISHFFKKRNIPQLVFDDDLIYNDSKLRYLLFMVPESLRPPNEHHLNNMQLSFGPTGSGTPLHAHVTAYNSLIFGLKKWYFIPPGTPGLLEGASDQKKYCFKKDNDIGFGGWCSFSRLDHVQKWLNSSSYKNISSYVSNCIQHPEETIFLPNGWAHATLNLEPTLAIAQEFCLDGSVTCHVMNNPISNGVYIP